LALGRSSGGVGDAEGERSLRDPALLKTADGDNYLFCDRGGGNGSERSGGYVVALRFRIFCVHPTVSGPGMNHPDYGGGAK